jgi:CubicO group peptidase (beta-lactamase class C family)
VKNIRRSGLLLAAPLIALICVASFAQAPKPADTKPAVSPATPPATPQTHDMTADDLSAFFDGLVPVQLDRSDIAGAVFAVVKDGKLLFTRGYGYADVEKKTPVNPETTLFRPGSISKTFTWTAVMQQVEQGKLDLDRDVNDYLDFKIPPAFGKPITLRNIMTHTSGFEETAKDLFVASDKDLVPIGDYLRAHMPARIFAPGASPAYSNYATTMAAYIVEKVSGQKFDDYVDEHFFKPLNMQHASFRQPLPAALQPDAATGYILASQPAKPYEWVQVAPAGSLAASAVDMTHWMIMHLQNGKYGDVQILKPETAIQMHARQEGVWPPAMPAMALGFYEESRNGHRIIGHGGDTVCFHSDLHLILDANVGIFMSFNSVGNDGASARGVVFDKFMNRYFPIPPPNEPVLATAAQDAQSVVGLYKNDRRFETNILAVTELLGEAKVSADPKDNTITFAFKNPNGQPKHFREVAPMVFREVDGQAKIAFVKDPSGRRVAYIDYPFMPFQQVDETLDKQGLNYFIICFGLGVVVLTLLFWPIGAMIRKHYGKPLNLDPGAKRLRLYVHLVCVLIVGYTLGLLWFVSLTSNPGGLSDSKDFGLHILQLIGLIAGLGSILALLNCLRSWGDANQWFWAKLWNTFLAFGCLGFFWFIYHWHLLNFHLNY